MKEIEIKVEIDDFEPIIEKLEKLGCEVSEPIEQEDTVFWKKDSAEKIFLRIRKSEGKNIFTLKTHVDDELDCIEKEIEISDPQILEEMIMLMGYVVYSKISKKRSTCNYKDYEICLDEVEGLGKFIEIEKISSEGVEVVRNNMMEFLKSLELDVSKRVFQGYDNLLLNKR